MMDADLTTPDPRRVFRWLHFSDIHVGVDQQSSLWPRFGTLLHDDLDRSLDRSGDIDTIIFSGDLVQQGQVAEFERFDDVISGILERIGRRQTRPKIITVPGNHDLARPGALAPAALALKQFWNDPKLREALWTQDGQEYRSFITRTFDNYLTWRAGAIERDIHVAPSETGLLPGDASYLVPTEAGQLGIIGLNSTWLQLSGSDYNGQLHVDAAQIHAITSGDPDKWTRNNDVNLLVTHHPARWLHANNPSSWDNDINPPGRFDLHLFGHMHQPDTTTIHHGGGLGRRDVQAASLFGLERYGNGEYERIQGYSANAVLFATHDRALTSWPRRLVQVTGGRMKLAPDSGQDIDEQTGSFTIPYAVERHAGPRTDPPSASDDAPPSPLNLATKSPFDLSLIQTSVASGKAHQKVRRIEQEACVSALKKDRIAWIGADWGMGDGGFIATICPQLSVSEDRVYSLDLSSYRKRDPFFDDLQTRFSCSFPQICEALADAGAAILVLDDIDLGSAANLTDGLEADVENLAKTVSDFASEVYVIIRSRRPPKTANFGIVELKALDEADVAVYARESEIGGERFAKSDAASILFRHTDGVPTRIDAALRDLEIISLKDLNLSNPDFGDTGGALVAAPAALVGAVQELKQSDDRAEQRAYSLLLALSALPQGEQLSRLKRFLGVHPFGPVHARYLLERSLIDTVNLATLDSGNDYSTDKALVVPRTVREYVRETIDEQLAKSIDRKALNLYFGDNWALGSIRSSPTGRRVLDALCDGYEIQNASTLILRSMRRALDSDDKLEIEGIIRLASAFIEVLISGDHFRSSASLCEDMIHLLEDLPEFDKQVSVYRYEYARSLRMLGRITDAQSTFERIDGDHLTKDQRQSAELGRALCFERQGDTDAAAEAARRTIALNKASNAALQAQIVMVQQLDLGPERATRLSRLLAIAKRKKSNTLVNNITLILADDAPEETDDSNALLRQVIAASSSKGDYYNAARAIVALAKKNGAEYALTEVDKGRLIEAYHYLYNERLHGLFDQCHGALWRIFEKEGDTANLLNLFRHSSFIWRLNGREAQEITYLAKLTKNVHNLIAQGFSQESRDGAYFAVRVTVVLGTLPGKLDLAATQ